MLHLSENVTLSGLITILTYNLVIDLQDCNQYVHYIDTMSRLCTFLPKVYINYGIVMVQLWHSYGCVLVCK